MWQSLGNQIGDAVLRLGDAFLAVVPALVVLVGAFAVGAGVGLVLRVALVLLFRALRIGTARRPC